MVRRSIALLGAALAVFHGWLFAAQVVSGAIADPGLLVRWLVAGGLIAGLVWLRRRRESLLGRKAIAIWVLAALLHGPALANRVEVPGAVGVPEAVVTLTFSLTALAVTGALVLAARRGLQPLVREYLVASATLTPPARHPKFALAFAPRPPPAV